MRLLLAVTLAALIFVSCSGDSGPDLKPLAVEVCARLSSDSPPRYRPDGSLSNAPTYVIYAGSSAVGMGATIQQYSEALRAQCPEAVERLPESYTDWLGVSD